MRRLLARLAEEERLPRRLNDALIRAFIRRFDSGRLAHAQQLTPSQRLNELKEHMAAMDAGPIAPAPHTSNRQHYALPPEFFELILGPWRKYSCCWWERGFTLAQAEETMLELTCRRAGVADGMRVLDLGCGWGSFTLYAATRFPEARLTAVSNSRPQGDFIRAQAQSRGLTNVTVLTRDMNDFTPEPHAYDRIVSVEMFEHMRNWRALLSRLATALTPEGALFVHVFSHRELAYFFEPSPEDWMAELFFSQGMMPSDALMLYCQEALVVGGHWRVDGGHYQTTCNAWLLQLDEKRDAALEVLERVHGEDADRWLQRWRMFFMACAELFGMHGGREWMVSHYLLKRREETA